MDARDIDAMLRRIATLEAALQPFSEEADGLEGYRDYQDGGELVFGVRVGDFRCARAALQEQTATKTADVEQLRRKE